jgi:hypothetical protein
MEIDLRIHFRRQKGGVLATVRMLTEHDIHFHRVLLPPDVDPADVQLALADKALRHLQRTGGPGSRVVTMQAPLPATAR